MVTLLVASIAKFAVMKGADGFDAITNIEG